MPGVTILRPLKGLETNLYENLESTFTQEYPTYEIFFCVDDEDDQALPVVRDLMAKYSHVSAHIAIGMSYNAHLHPFLIVGYRQGIDSGCQPEGQQSDDRLPEGNP